MIDNRNLNDTDLQFVSSSNRINNRIKEGRFCGSDHAVRVSIALLTDDNIESMNADELLFIVQSADIKPVDNRVLRILRPLSIEDLRRLVHATRTACQIYVENETNRVA